MRLFYGSFGMVFLLLLHTQAWGLTPDLVPIGRYLTVSYKPDPEQMNLLSQTIQIHFPPSTQTIGDAMNTILRFSGYSLVPENQMNLAFKNTLQKPLPLIDRNMGPVTLQSALKILAGPAFTLKSDSLNRTIDFTIKE